MSDYFYPMLAYKKKVENITKILDKLCPNCRKIVEAALT